MRNIILKILYWIFLIPAVIVSAIGISLGGICNIIEDSQDD